MTIDVTITNISVTSTIRISTLFDRDMVTISEREGGGGAVVNKYKSDCVCERERGE